MFLLDFYLLFLAELRLLLYYYVSGCGKTTFCYKFIKSRDYLASLKIESIIWCYAVLQDELLQLQKECPILELHEGFKSEVYQNLDPHLHKLLIIDDMMTGIK